MKSWPIIALLTIISTNAFACSKIENEIAHNLALEAWSSIDRKSGVVDFDLNALPPSCTKWLQRPGSR